MYSQGENIILSGAEPSAGSLISGWTGSNNDASTSAANTVAMPSGNHVVNIVYSDSPPAVRWVVRASTNPTGATNLNYTVGFTESVTGVDITDFTLDTNGVDGATVSSVSGSGASYTVAVNSGVGSGTLRLNISDNNSIVDVVGNPLGGSGVQNFIVGQTYTLDKTAPITRWVVRASANPSVVGSVDYTVGFTETVTGVDASDFRVSGIADALVASVTGSGVGYTVTVYTGTGSGTLRLDLIDDNSIVDGLGNPLGGSGAQNYTGQVYTIDKVGPTVRWVVRASPNPSGAATVNYTVGFTETVTGVDVSDFNLAISGVSGASVAGVSGSGTSYMVTVNTGTGNGTINLSLLDNESIIDVLGNSLGGVGAQNFTGQTYTMAGR